MALKPNVIFVLGPPGSGKGTQSSLITKTYSFAHLSAGDLLREELKNESSPHHDVIKKNIDAGTIVPVEITCSLIKNRMDAICSQGIWNFIIDGFPRNWDNVNGWEKTMTESTNLVTVLYFDAPDDLCVARCLLRRDESGRTDDNLECLKKRILTYKNDTVPIINYFMDKGIVQKLDASKATDEVFEDIKKLLTTSFSESELIPKVQAFSP